MKMIQGAIGKNDAPSTVDMFLDSGFPPLNYALSGSWDGGFAVGRIVEISGPPSSGKTAIATMAMISAQKAGGFAAFMDHERSFAEPLAIGLGLNISPSNFVFKKPETFEDSIEIAAKLGSVIRKNKLIDAKAPIVVVFDSLAGMVPQSAMFDAKGKERDASTRNMNDNSALARATSAHFPALNQHAEKYNMCLIFLNQVRNKIGVVFGDPRTTPGGDAPKFWASQRVMLGASMIKVATDPKPLGQEVTANVIKNKVSRPFLKASWRFMYQPDGSGRFDFERSMVDFLIGEDVIKKGSKPGTIIWEDAETKPETLARKIERAGEYGKLVKMLKAEVKGLKEEEAEESAFATMEDAIASI
ncbi:MAG: hypothetical protein ACEQSB_00515 [Undibacterium sp.]